MKILVLGGTRFFGIELVNNLLEKGHEVTIATRGTKKDDFGTAVNRIIVEHTDIKDMENKFKGMHFDIIYDDLAYCSNDVKYTLENVSCDRYIMVSSAMVYPLYWNMKEMDFKPEEKELAWCNREHNSYGEGKRLAESALVNQYKHKKSVIVRMPFVLGENDYTGRLKYYVDHVKAEKPMFIDNLDCQVSLISAKEAGAFLAFLAESSFCGILNACSQDTISMKEILEYVESRTGKKSILNLSGEKAPFNGTEEYSLNTEAAKTIGYEFTNVRDWIFDLLDEYCE